MAITLGERRLPLARMAQLAQLFGSPQGRAPAREGAGRESVTQLSRSDCQQLMRDAV
jgi:hypothetical protein